MASVAESGLFPPIMDAYLPAFSLKDIGRSDPQHFTIQYDISDFNDLDDVYGIHVSITRQSNYKSLFKTDSEHYPMGVYVENVERPVTSRKCSVDINLSNINLSELSYNEYYKVQVRLSRDSDYTPMTGVDLSNYLTNTGNMAKCSEWSTVCLIRFIAPAELVVDANGITLPIDYGQSQGDRINTSNISISGVYTKYDVNNIVNLPSDSPIKTGANDKEYLSSYRVRIYYENTLEFDSGDLEVDIFHNTSLYYDIPYYFENNKEVILKISYITANLYEKEDSYTILPVYDEGSAWSEQSVVSESLSLDSMIGKVNITFSPQGLPNQGPIPNPPTSFIPAGAKFKIRRSSDETDFKLWETIWTKTVIEPEAVGISFDDFTIESGVLYKYEINYIGPKTPEQGSETGIFTIVKDYIISVFDHAFLTGEGTQLCVKFNPNISGYKRNVSDNIVNTIGGKYPYITRNGNMDYRSFSLSGTIAYEMDIEHQFSSRSSIYGDWIDIYGTYFVNRYINQQNDKITQRKFRELVLNFLCNDIPKLFRSTPEGNILVRITDVNLTPNQQLSRMIYDFTCTATEIGEANIENCKLYEIQDFGE